MDNILSWKHHIDLLNKKLCMACYIIRNVKAYMSALSLKMIYHTFFHSAMRNGIIFWGNLSHSSTIFRLQKKKRQLELWKDVGTVSCRNLFKKLQILSLTSQCILSLLMFVVQNKNLFSRSTENNNIDTRQRNNLYLLQANLTIYQRGAYYSGIKIINNFPLDIKNVTYNQKGLKLLWIKFIHLFILYNVRVP